MALQDEIDARSGEIRTDSYPMSVGEIINLYRDGDLDLHPEFQRFFRWTATQKSRLIESILLGIPIPSIFVAQREDGVWDVIDGLQRLGTILQFVGLLRDEQGATLPPLTLEGTKYLPSLEGKAWDNPAAPDHSLTEDQRRFIKRSKLVIQIILRQSHDATKYELFQRLNTGGSDLSDQETRNCILVMVNRNMFTWLRDLSQEPDFQACIPLSERAQDEQYDLELVVRFLVLRKWPEDKLRGIRDLGEFLTEQLVRLAQDPTYDQAVEAQAFRSVFALLNQALNGDSFRRHDATRDRFLGAFSISAFEAVAIGTGFHGEELASGAKILDIENRVKSIWANGDFRTGSGTGVRAGNRLPVLIPLGRAIFKP